MKDKTPPDLTVADLLNLSAFSPAGRQSLHLETDHGFGVEAGSYKLRLHGVSLAKAPGLAKELKALGFDVDDAMKPMRSDAWTFGAKIAVGMWNIRVVAFVNWGETKPEPPPPAPPKRDPLPLSDVADLHDDSPHGDVGDVQAMP